MRRRISAFITILLFLISVSGLQVSVHYCGNEQMFVAVNGVPVHHYSHESGDCCHGGKTSCPGCHNHSHYLKIRAPFSVGQVVSLHPCLSDSGCLYSGLATLWPSCLWHAQMTSASRASYHYVPPAPPGLLTGPRGMRAPPVA